MVPYAKIPQSGAAAVEAQQMLSACIPPDRLNAQSIEAYDAALAKMGGLPNASGMNEEMEESGAVEEFDDHPDGGRDYRVAGPSLRGDLMTAEIVFNPDGERVDQVVVASRMRAALNGQRLMEYDHGRVAIHRFVKQTTDAVITEFARSAGAGPIGLIGDLSLDFLNFEPLNLDYDLDVQQCQFGFTSLTGSLHMDGGALSTIGFPEVSATLYWDTDLNMYLDAGIESRFLDFKADGGLFLGRITDLTPLRNRDPDVGSFLGDVDQFIGGYASAGVGGRLFDLGCLMRLDAGGQVAGWVRLDGPPGAKLRGWMTGTGGVSGQRPRRSLPGRLAPGSRQHQDAGWFLGGRRRGFLRRGRLGHAPGCPQRQVLRSLRRVGQARDDLQSPHSNSPDGGFRRPRYGLQVMRAREDSTMHRRFLTRTILTTSLFAAVAVAAVLAEPALDRTLVAAVADDSTDRILVRWRLLEGDARYTHFDVLRRDASSPDFTQINDDPIGALDTVQLIEAEFNAVDRGDALTGITASLGAGYAAAILGMRALDAGEEALVQLRLLPEVNYVGAQVLGRGWIDDTALNGTTYVYEVWGLDEQGFRLERLGRATATSGSPLALPAPDQTACAELAGNEADGRAFLRWDEPAGLDEPFFGYELYRAPRLPNQTCPSVGPGQPGSVRANASPTMGDAPGGAALGRLLFNKPGSCSGCHAGGRDLPVAQNGVQFTTIRDFRRLQFPEINEGGIAPHDTPFLNDLTDESLRGIYRYIQEYRFSDDGSGAPGEAFDRGETYCYTVALRNLFGDPGTPSATQQCRVRDQRAPRPPGGLFAERIDQGGYETCRVSWQRNAAADDDTTQYRIYRVDSIPKLDKDVDTDCDPACDEQISIVQPGAGERVQWTDPGLSSPDAGRTFFYSVVAEDVAGDGVLQGPNRSAFSSWVPCTPTDIVDPPSGNLSVGCCSSGGCENKGAGADWRLAGGVLGYLVTDPTSCPPQIDYDFPGDTFRYRLYTSVTGVDGAYRSGRDHAAQALPDLSPSLTTKVYWKARGYDKSQNFSAFSNPVSMVLQGVEALPVPQILSVELLSLLNKEVKIRFRGLKTPAGPRLRALRMEGSEVR